MPALVVRFNQRPKRYAVDEPDLVMYFVRLINDRLPSVSTNALMEMEHELRLRYGGRRFYVTRKLKSTTL